MQGSQKLGFMESHRDIMIGILCDDITLEARHEELIEVSHDI